MFDIDVEFWGRNASIRGYFNNKLYNEDIIHYFFGNIIPSLSIDEYIIDDYKGENNPFKISVRGNSFNIAIKGVGRITLQPILYSDK